MEKDKDTKGTGDKLILDDYKVLEWTEQAFCQCCKVIINGRGAYIQQIRLDNGSNVYLLSEEYYLAAKAALKREMTTIK